MLLQIVLKNKRHRVDIFTKILFMEKGNKFSYLFDYFEIKQTRP